VNYLPLDKDEITDEWFDRFGKKLYTPQGYEGYRCGETNAEMYLLSVIDLDLDVYYCISVRWRPKDEPEVRDHLFVRFPLLMAEFGNGFSISSQWRGDPHSFSEDGSDKLRQVMADFWTFIEDGAG
jgi:hypothetical protein